MGNPSKALKARLVRIGNSRGIRLPKPLIEQVGLHDEIELRVHEGALVITPTEKPRKGWAQAARLLRERNDDRLLDDPTSTRFDDKDWKWR